MGGERGPRATSFGENGKKGGEDENGTTVNIANIFSAKEDFEEVPDSEEEEDEVEDIHVSEVESDYEDLPPPSPPSPPPPPIVVEDPPVEEVVEEDDEEEEEEEEERQPSAKSLPVGHIVPHRER